jgi:hypothetical protein
MRDLDAFLNSLANFDRATLIVILSAEAKTAAKLAMNARQRTPQQRARRQEAIERADRLGAILTFLRDRNVAPGMAEKDIELCKAIEQQLHL